MSSEQMLPDMLNSADVIDLSSSRIGGIQTGSFKQSVLQLLTVKLRSSQNVKKIILSGNDVNPFENESVFQELKERLGLLATLQEISLFDCYITAKDAERLAEPLGKLTALQKLKLGSAVCSVLHGLDSVVLFGGAMHDIGLCM
jgi:hypothetical protein